MIFDEGQDNVSKIDADEGWMERNEKENKMKCVSNKRERERNVKIERRKEEVVVDNFLFGLLN